jgi:hypothetical protein
MRFIKVLAVSYQLSAISFSGSCRAANSSRGTLDPLYEGRQHPFDLSDSRLKMVVICGGQEFQVPSQQQMIFQLAGRAIAIHRNRAKSGSPPRPQPSARFAGIEEEARRIWLVRPYISWRGNV